MNYLEQLNNKKQHLTQLLAAFYSGDIAVYPSEESHYRMRAEFRVWHEGDDLYHIMFDKQTKQPYRVDQFPAANRLINEVMSRLIAALKQQPLLRQKLFQIDYLSCLNQQIVVSLLYHKALTDEWETAIRQLKDEVFSDIEIHFIGRARKQKRIVEQDFVIERLPTLKRTFEFKHIENSFTQPNANVNCKMIEWAAQCGACVGGDLLELYCGAGNFSIPLATVFDRVMATEIAKTSVEAAQYNIAANNIDNCTIVRLSSEEFVEAYQGVREFRRLRGIDITSYDFSTVLVDPPRAGLDPETCRMIAQFDNIIYISCNPNTLAENLAVLADTHHIVDAALFDQFPFTEHMEAGVFLQKALTLQNQ